MPKISVIIPSYNHEPYIKLAVESVLSQSDTDLELIVVDDGSTDNSLGYLKCVHDRRFKLVAQTNQGAHQAINNGLSLAQGECLAILNSDDIFHPQRLSLCLEKLQGDIDLTATWLEVINHKGKVLGIKEGWKNMLPWPISAPSVELTSADVFAANLLQSNFVSTTSNIVFTRKLYEGVGDMSNLRFVHDWDFLLRAVINFRCELVEIPLLQYRIHKKNTITSNRAWMLFEICWIYAVHYIPVMHKLKQNPPKQSRDGDEIDFMAHSINLQGNDKVLWMILQFIESKIGRAHV